MVSLYQTTRPNRRENPYHLPGLSRFDGQRAVVIINICRAVVFSHLVVRHDTAAKKPVTRGLVRRNCGVRHN